MGNKEQIEKMQGQIAKMQENIHELYDFIDQLKEVIVSLHKSSKNHNTMFTDIHGALVCINDKFEHLNALNGLQAALNEQFEKRIEALEEKVKE